VGSLDLENRIKNKNKDFRIKNKENRIKNKENRVKKMRKF